MLKTACRPSQSQREERWDDWEGPIVSELTDEDVQTQDFIDNTIHNMLCELVVSLTGQKIQWDTAVIHEVLKTIRQELWNRYGIRIPYAVMEEKE
jgi:hypothetical protein